MSRIIKFFHEEKDEFGKVKAEREDGSFEWVVPNFLELEKQWQEEIRNAPKDQELPPE